MGIKDDRNTSTTGHVLQGRFAPRRPPQTTAALNEAGRHMYDARRAEHRDRAGSDVYRMTLGDYLIMATLILNQSTAAERLVAQTEYRAHDPVPLQNVLADLKAYSGTRRNRDPERAINAAVAFYSAFYGSMDTEH